MPERQEGPFPTLADVFSHEAEEIAKAFHEAYEAWAPRFGYRTRDASAVPWDQVPSQNRALMCRTVQQLLNDEVIQRVV